jgi:hypothetical protein
MIHALQTKFFLLGEHQTLHYMLKAPMFLFEIY